MPEDAASAETLADLVHAYTFPPWHLITPVFESAPSIGGGRQAGNLVLSGSEIVMPGDIVRVSVDHVTGHTTGLTFEATVDRLPVGAAVEYRRLPDGPSYPARAEVLLLDRRTKMIIENHDFQQHPAIM